MTGFLEQFTQTFRHRCKAVLFVGFLRPAEVAHEDELRPLHAEDVLQRRQGGGDARVVAYDAILDGHVEIDAHEHALPREVNVADGLFRHGRTPFTGGGAGIVCSMIERNRPPCQRPNSARRRASSPGRGAAGSGAAAGAAVGTGHYDLVAGVHEVRRQRPPALERALAHHFVHSGHREVPDDVGVVPGDSRCVGGGTDLPRAHDVEPCPDLHPVPAAEVDETLVEAPFDERAAGRQRIRDQLPYAQEHVAYPVVARAERAVRGDCCSGAGEVQGRRRREGAFRLLEPQHQGVVGTRLLGRPASVGERRNDEAARQPLSS